MTRDEIDHMLQVIQEPRKIETNNFYTKREEPFIVPLLKEGKVESILPPSAFQKAKIELHGVMNQRAYINYRWVAQGEMVLNYKVKSIGHKGVTLEKEGKEIYLPLTQRIFRLGVKGLD
jgi:hypothetical protein